jgi:hypothetical protein
MSSNPYHTSDEKLLLQIATAAEARLAAQLTAALAADQRALVFAGFLAAAAIALGGAAASLLAKMGSDRFLGQLAFVAACSVAVAMALAVQAARPTKWYFPGGRPKDWVKDIETQKPQLQRLSELLEDYDDRIVHNEAIMAGNGRLLRLAAVLSSITIILSAAHLAVRTAVFTGG